MEKVGSTDTAKALIFTTKFKIEGFIHLLFKDSYRGRLSDHLNSARAPVFIPITNASVSDLNGKKLYDTKCIIVNRNLIEAVIEDQD